MTRLRYLRLKYGITLSELAREAGISNQHLSRLERCVAAPSSRQEKRVALALWSLIESRQRVLLRLKQDVLISQGQLLQPVEGLEYEL